MVVLNSQKFQENTSFFSFMFLGCMFSHFVHSFVYIRAKLAVKNSFVPLTLFHMRRFRIHFDAFTTICTLKFWFNFMWFLNCFFPMLIFSQICHLPSSFAWFCLWTANLCLLWKVWPQSWQIDFIAILILKYIYNFI